MPDARLYQIAVLLSFFCYSLFLQDAQGIERSLISSTAVVITILLSQFAFSKMAKVPRIDLKSALISGLSLSLLLRANTVGYLLLAAVLAIGSKFVLRVQGKHFFNPTNFAIAVLLLLTDKVWVSPAQWGTELLFAGFVACAGMVVVQKAQRSDITWAFLLFFVGFLLSRALWLGDPLSIPLHQLKSGALLIFAFYMISDPRSTPNSRFGRVVFAGLVVMLAYYLRFSLYNPNALILALFFVSPLTLILDIVFPAQRFKWGTPLLDGRLPIAEK